MWLPNLAPAQGDEAGGADLSLLGDNLIEFDRIAFDQEGVENGVPLRRVSPTPG